MKTTTQCDGVAERIALGEDLGELAEHAGSCARCQRVVAISGQLGATHHDVDPGLGFAARMTVGAQHRIAVRRRRRVAVALAGTVAASALGVVFVTRSPEVAMPPDNRNIAAEMPRGSDEQPLADEELEMLVDYANTERSMKMTADWRRIDRPLSPYRRLIKGVTQ